MFSIFIVYKPQSACMYSIVISTSLERTYTTACYLALQWQPKSITVFRQFQNFTAGATGFISKVFIEKALRSCPDVGDIYILIRPRRGRSVRERMNEIFTEQVCTL